MKQTEPTIDLSMRTPIINNDKEVFTNKRDFINHCLEVTGYQRGIEVTPREDGGALVWEMLFCSQSGRKYKWVTSWHSEQDLWDRAEREALRQLESLNSNRVYDSHYTLEDVIASAKASGEDATYWQDLLDTLNASVNL